MKHKTTSNGGLTVCGKTAIKETSTWSWEDTTCPECLKFRPKWATKEYYKKREGMYGNKRRKSI